MGHEFHVERGLHESCEGVVLACCKGGKEFVRELLEEVGDDFFCERGGGGGDLGVNKD